ncbi:MarR family transcriptional regulator [Burkholderia vietnamiensis]|jgi:DNA-binding MarR family transcriptional regulator|uniref:Transcriptional regulator, MarR family n=2 Tax=Burkholderia vietnamiensis TaxID=60552 RepID=A4JP48_BURVG|nr:MULTISPECIES: MarR family transcriptional regulator [Burkholderia]ABO58051.1 transcriptional regulator, MarR family [Burkholderia vietnamiensis G4]TPQ42531.1 MarR family transcriptional regulator [Burkholderia ubonensis]AFJ88471.1 Transcriptional regulator, MarR family [Burkholderia sp. KJ006]AJY03703.1 winged helix DNA-binding domain protein [Burkholderia vietnamiensis LMG 10929]AOJ15989.1 MarR family transcriptional regulator [Burkholderia vietnamiensis]
MLGRMNPPRTSGVTADTVATDLTLAVGQLIRRLRSEIDSEGLGMSQTSALARLERQGPMTTAELARAEAMKPQSMKAILASLEEDGLVEREPHPTDGRQILFLLTAAGREARRKRNAAKHAWLGAAIGKLEPDEMRTLADAIALIRRLGEQ